eukprot:15599_1
MRESHREQNMNSCEWKILFSCLHSAIEKIHKAFHFKNDRFYVQYVRKRNENKLFHGLHKVSFDENKQIASLHTITSFSECYGVAKSFTYDDGLIFAVQDAFKSIYNGDVKAADISWISKFSNEVEWIVLPVTLTSVLNVTNDKKYFKYLKGEHIKVYQAKFEQNNYNLKVSKFFQKMILMLYKYNKKENIAQNDNILIHYIRNEEREYEKLIQMTFYINYHSIIYDNELYKQIRNEMNKYNIENKQLAFIWIHINNFLNKHISNAKATEMNYKKKK